MRVLFFGAVRPLRSAGSALGLFAGNFALLMVARLVQAIGSGLFIPLMMNTILAVTPKNKLGACHGHRWLHDHLRSRRSPRWCAARMVTVFGWHSVFVGAASSPWRY